jgi:hypothetical protein
VLLDGLSPRELEVLGLVAGGLTNEAIADRLCLSVRTVERHVSTIYANCVCRARQLALRPRSRLSRSDRRLACTRVEPGCVYTVAYAACAYVLAPMTRSRVAPRIAPNVH